MNGGSLESLKGRPLSGQSVAYAFEHGLKSLQPIQVEGTQLLDDFTITHPLLEPLLRKFSLAIKTYNIPGAKPGYVTTTIALRHAVCDEPLFPLQAGKPYSVTLTFEENYDDSSDASNSYVKSQTDRFQINVTKEYDSRKMGAEIPWLKVNGGDVKDARLFRLTTTKTTSQKYLSGRSDLVALPATTYPGYPLDFVYIAGPEVAVQDLSDKVDDLIVNVSLPTQPKETQPPPQQDHSSELRSTSEPKGRSPAANLTGKERAHYDTLLKTGRPSQMYLLALDLDREGHADLARRMFEAIVTRFPEDPYAAKVIDRLESSDKAAK